MEGFSEEKKGWVTMGIVGLRSVPEDFTLGKMLCPTLSGSLVSLGHILSLHSHSLSPWTLSIVILKSLSPTSGG